MNSNANYVNMGEGFQPGTTTITAPGLDDPSLSQEERDLRLALALQQQENAAAYGAHKKSHEAAAAAQKNRTTRSSCSTGLAAIRKAQKSSEKDPERYAVNDGTYYAPGTMESSDAALAAELQKVEQATAGTAQLMDQIVREENKEKETSKIRSGRSHYHM
jgi:type IV secretory pathway VirJ component